jgi:H-type lectin domain
MKTRILPIIALSSLTLTGNLFAQGTAFTYQGRLIDTGSPATGNYDFRFRLAADPQGNTYLGSPVLTNGISVSSGLFVATIDFGAGWFNGSNYWLEVDVRTNGGSYVSLTPMQALTPTPYAIFATTASNLSGTLPTAQLSGPVPSVNFSGTYGNALTLNNAGNNFSGSYAGNGGSLTNINAAALGGLASSNFWQLGGNNVANGQFLGSTNNQPVEVHVGGVRGMRVELYPVQINVSNIVNIVNGSPVNFVTPGIYGGTIGGGGAAKYTVYSYTNSVTGVFGTVAGGAQNSSGPYATVGGGQANTAAGGSSVVAGGQANQGSGSWGSVGGGFGNTAGNVGATVPGGYDNTANGVNSFAAGYYAQALHDGAFVWADDSQFAPFTSTTTNQFLIRALGGVGINTAVTPDNYFSVNTNAYLFSHIFYLRGETGSDHNHGLAYNGNTVTNFGTGNYQIDGPALWGFGGGLLGTRNGGDHAALTWNTSGVTVNGTLTGNAIGLTNLSATQLSSGTIPLARLPSAVVTNFENGLTMSNLTLSGTLNFPQYDYYAATPLSIFAGTNLLLRTGPQGSFYFGPNAGNTNNAGQQNTAFGTYALNALTSGDNNVAVGLNTLSLDTSGNNNTSVGLGALYVNKTGNDNTASGFAALGENVTGSNNVAVGSGALEFLGSVTAGGSANIALGYNAGSVYTANESGNIDIGHVGGAGENNIIRLGTPGSHTSAFIAGVVTDVGGVQVGANGTTMSLIQSGQAIMPSSTLVATNFTVTFPRAFSSTPKVIASLSGDPGFPNAGDTFSMSIRAITTTTGFTVNVVRVDTASGWSQQLRVNWQAWQ